MPKLLFYVTSSKTKLSKLLPHLSGAIALIEHTWQCIITKEVMGDLRLVYSHHNYCFTVAGVVRGASSSMGIYWSTESLNHNDVIKRKYFPRYWPFVLRIHWSPVNSPHKGQWRGALIFFYLRLNKRLGKQSRRWWFETPSFSLWRHCNIKWLACRWYFERHFHKINILCFDFKFKVFPEGAVGNKSSLVNVMAWH